MDSYHMEAPKSTLIYPAQYVSVAPEINQIRDWLPWSIINLFFGLGGGLLPLIFSIICRSNKRSNDVNGARTMSTLALVFNIVATIGALFIWIILVVYIIAIASYASKFNQTISMDGN